MMRIFIEKKGGWGAVLWLWAAGCGAWLAAGGAGGRWLAAGVAGWLRAILEVFYPAIHLTRYRVYRSKQKKLLLFKGLITHK